MVREPRTGRPSTALRSSSKHRTPPISQTSLVQRAESASPVRTASAGPLQAISRSSFLTTASERTGRLLTFGRSLHYKEEPRLLEGGGAL
jgi:hypothetical protein